MTIAVDLGRKVTKQTNIYFQVTWEPVRPLTEYRPGLGAGISGAGYLKDRRSVASSVQSSNVAAITQALNDH